MSLLWIHAIIWPCVNALVGILAFEWCWHVTKPIREIDEARDSKYPAFRRNDAKNWRRWKFYPGAMTFFVFRLFLAIFNLLLCYILTKIICAGANIESGRPITGCRCKAIRYLYLVQARIEMLAFGYRFKTRKLDFDYSEYLGPDYKETMKLPKKISTIVSNHSSWFDPLLLNNIFACGFVAKREVKTAPVGGVIAMALGSIFISRGGSPEELQKIVDEIDERQRMIEDYGEYPPFIVFPEGGTSNGSCILPFKRGAF